MSLANIFSPSVGCLFILFIVSFAVQKFEFKVVPFVFFLFSFTLSWEIGQKRYCCNLCQSVLLVFSSRSFIVYSLTFRSLIHFELIFVYGVKELSDFIVLLIACSTRNIENVGF